MFNQFWSLYPNKQAKKRAFIAWNKITLEQQKKAIDKIESHVSHWQQLDWYYPPLPASWLNDWRFDDDLPEVKVMDWMKSDQATLAYGNQKKMPPKIGESTESYRARLRAA